VARLRESGAGSGSGGFSDIGGVWQEAQDAINALAAKGMIPAGGEFRPRDAITRAEMATFLIGLLVQGAPNVRETNQGELNLYKGNTRTNADHWDWFADARALVPAESDGEISALFELGVTRGASAAAVQDKYAPPLDFDYEPFGTVDRGEMAEFITRALAHTSARPEGISAQSDGSFVVVSMRDNKYQPMAGELVDVFTVSTSNEDVAFKTNGECTVEVTPLGGEHACEIDGADPITGGDGDARQSLEDTVVGAGLTVWAWSGEDGDEFDDDTVRHRFEITEDPPAVADRVRITASHPGTKKVHLGDSVLYTVQLENRLGPVTIGPDSSDPRPSRFLVTLSTYRITDAGRNPQGASLTTTIPLVTNDDGKATFPVSAGLPDPDPAMDRDKYVVEIHIQGVPDPEGNAPPIGAYYLGSSSTAQTASATGIVAVRQATSNSDYFDGLVFSTEENDALTVPTETKPGVTLSVSPAARWIASDARGVSTRATVKVVDQYNDPIAGPEVSLTTNATDAGGTTIVISGGQAVSVGRDGSYTFGYTRENGASATETLTAMSDHDGDATDDTPTPAITGTATVEWAALADDAVTTAVQIRSFDKDTNTIYAGADGAVVVLYYDENDRFNIIRTVNGSPVESTSTYAGFEGNLSTFTGYLLAWDAFSIRGRAVNEFTLTVPA